MYSVPRALTVFSILVRRRGSVSMISAMREKPCKLLSLRAERCR
jgi:hypothetical protein